VKRAARACAWTPRRALRTRRVSRSRLLVVTSTPAHVRKLHALTWPRARHKRGCRGCGRANQCETTRRPTFLSPARSVFLFVLVFRWFCNDCPQEIIATDPSSRRLRGAEAAAVGPSARGLHYTCSKQTRACARTRHTCRWWWCRGGCCGRPHNSMRCGNPCRTPWSGDWVRVAQRRRDGITLCANALIVVRRTACDNAGKRGPR
jgi:hypothetical protein